MLSQLAELPHDDSASTGILPPDPVMLDPGGTAACRAQPVLFDDVIDLPPRGKVTAALQEHGLTPVGQLIVRKLVADLDKQADNRSQSVPKCTANKAGKDAEYYQ